MENIGITWETILVICGGIGVIGGGIGYIKKLAAPITNLKTKVDEHEESIKKDERKLNDIEEATKVQNKVLLALVDHEITGNSIEKLKNAKNELQDYLINR